MVQIPPSRVRLLLQLVHSPVPQVEQVIGHGVHSLVVASLNWVPEHEDTQAPPSRNVPVGQLSQSAEDEPVQVLHEPEQF